MAQIGSGCCCIVFSHYPVSKVKFFFSFQTYLQSWPITISGTDVKIVFAMYICALDIWISVLWISVLWITSCHKLTGAVTVHFWNPPTPPPPPTTNFESHWSHKHNNMTTLRGRGEGGQEGIGISCLSFGINHHNIFGQDCS